jgi:hypothetical protein
MTNTTPQFVTEAMDAMRMHAKDQYDRLLTGPYGVFQVDCEAVDDMVAPMIPQSTRIEIAQDLGKAVWGLHPLLDSPRVELFLPEMIRRLDAIVKWCDAGHEFDIWCEFDDATGEIALDADDE